MWSFETISLSIELVIIKGDWERLFPIQIVSFFTASTSTGLRMSIRSLHGRWQPWSVAHSSRQRTAHRLSGHSDQLWSGGCSPSDWSTVRWGDFSQPLLELVLHCSPPAQGCRCMPAWSFRLRLQYRCRRHNSFWWRSFPKPQQAVRFPTSTAGKSTWLRRIGGSSLLALSERVQLALSIEGTAMKATPDSPDGKTILAYGS